MQRDLRNHRQGRQTAGALSFLASANRGIQRLQSHRRKNSQHQSRSQAQRQVEDRPGIDGFGRHLAGLNHSDVGRRQSSHDSGLLQLQLQRFVEILGGFNFVFQNGVLRGALVQVKGLLLLLFKLGAQHLLGIGGRQVFVLVAFGQVLPFSVDCTIDLGHFVPQLSQFRIAIAEFGAQTRIVHAQLRLLRAQNLQRGFGNRRGEQFGIARSRNAIARLFYDPVRLGGR